MSVKKCINMIFVAFAQLILLVHFPYLLYFIYYYFLCICLLMSYVFDRIS